MDVFHKKAKASVKIKNAAAVMQAHFEIINYTLIKSRNCILLVHKIYQHLHILHDIV